MLDPFRLCLSMLPLGVYLLGLASMIFARRPVVVTGARDMAALGVAFIGLLIMGPIELLMPTLPSEPTGNYGPVLRRKQWRHLTLGGCPSDRRLGVYNVSPGAVGRGVVAETRSRGRAISLFTGVRDAWTRW